MFSICKQVIGYGEDLYVVNKTIKDKEGLDMELLKSYYEADLILKKEGIIYFTQKIENLDYEQIVTP